jgi:hypothetical protein
MSYNTIGMGNQIALPKTTTFGLIKTAAANEQFQAMINSANKSVSDLLKIDTLDSKTLQGEYKNFINGIQGVVYSDNMTNGEIAAAVNPVRDKLEALDSRRNSIINSYVVHGNFFLNVWSEINYYLKMMMLVLGPLFAFIIITNTVYAKDVSYKIFYGLWGAIWYPLTLLFGIYNPPSWVATIIPLEKSDLPVSFFQFWAYNISTDPVTTEKGKTMLRLISIALTILFYYSFFVVA